MTQPSVETLTLFDLVAREWQAGAPVAELAFSRDGTALAAATMAGGVAIAAVADAEPPEARIRVSGDVGQTTIRPRTGQPVPLVALGGLADRAPALAALQGGFLVGDGDGRVLRVAADGSAAPIAITLRGPVLALDAGAADRRIAASDGLELVVLDDGGPTRFALRGAAALGFAPDGARLGVALGDGLAIVEASGALRILPLPAEGPVRWRGDGACLAAGLGPAGLGIAAAGSDETATLGNFPGAVRSLAWSARGRALVAAGAFRIAAWDEETLPGAAPRPLICGRAGLVLVEAVAAHPTRGLVAAGLANGQVLIAEIGGRDELLLRQGGEAVTALAFSPDGRHLAIGDAGGKLAIATFPPQLFK